MSLNHQDLSLENSGQSPGWDPTKSSKRNSGLFSFLKWFKPSSSRESIEADAPNSLHSSSCDSLNSNQSTGTAASFSFISPSAYTSQIKEKSIVLGPETDTYKARLKQRDKHRENDKNLTLRKKYNLFFNRDSLLRVPAPVDDENTKSLPLLTRAMPSNDEEKMHHRRTNSESSKIRKAGAYLHVKGKRRAPQPPGVRVQEAAQSTMSLRRKKRLAPTPPVLITRVQADVISNDSLKLDHGFLKPVKETTVVSSSSPQNNSSNVANSPSTSTRSSYVEAPVSPRPWYKRNPNRDSLVKQKENKYEPIEIPQESEKYDKRKSGIAFLTNISELDREACEIVRKEHEKHPNQDDLQELPEFMKSKLEPKPANNTDSWVSPKRRSARDLIAKFNAITNVTKVTVFGVSQNKESKQNYFGKQTSLDETKPRQENLLENHRKRLEALPIMKSESVSNIKPKPETPKMDRKNWKCPKCNIDNDYWRIICHVCSSIKPYFDEFISSPLKTEVPVEAPLPKSTINVLPAPLERSKTQIAFSALANYNAKKKIEKSISLEEKKVEDKREEKEKLKKMLIEMKNSLPKRKSVVKPNSRASMIEENTEESILNTEPIYADEVVENNTEEAGDKINTKEKTQEEKVAEILIGTQKTLYENIKVKQTDNPKPIKVSASVQTSSVPKTIVPPLTITNLLKSEPPIKPPDSPIKKNKHYELMRPKDFETITADQNVNTTAKIYANLAQNDELSLFFNMPKRFSQIKKDLAQNNTDTIEINRLLRRLETAIAKGDLIEAATFAKELAQLKVNCSVIRQKSQEEEVQPKLKSSFRIEMFVEDKVSHRGPFSLLVSQTQTVAELKKQVEKELEIPVNVQRWILGKELATNDKATLSDHHVTTEGCPVFLYLVAPGAEEASSSKGSPHTPKIVEVIPKGAEMKLEEPKIVRIFEPNNGQVKETKLQEPLKTETKPNKLLETTNILQKPVENGLQAEAKALEPLKKEEVKKPQPINLIKEIPPLKLNKELEVNKEQQQNVVVKENVNILKQIKEDGKLQQNKYTKKKVKPPNEDKTLVKEPLKLAIKTEPPLVLQNHVTVQPPLAKEEDLEEFDTKTLRPPKEWECQRCTLLNPLTSDHCALCFHRPRVKHLEKPTKRKAPVTPQPSSSTQTYQQLVNLDNSDLVETTEPFECLICFMETPVRGGVTLRECLHQFCKTCLAHTIEYCEEAQVRCPFRDPSYACNIALQDREIKALVSKTAYEQYLARSVSQAENKIGKSFHCKTPDCRGWCIFEDNVNEFRCPVCRRTNCLTCQAIHLGMNCKQYQQKMNEESSVDDDAKRTKEMLDEMVQKGEALTCPTCQVILMKKWGCDWLRCSMCKTEICWVTRGPRWGPAGKGDTSGGCQCGVNGVKCHPQCNYCH